MLHAYFGPGSSAWWSTPLALWLTMTLVTLAGVLWAWHRQVRLLAETLPGTGTQDAATTLPTEEAVRPFVWAPPPPTQGAVALMPAAITSAVSEAVESTRSTGTVMLAEKHPFAAPRRPELGTLLALSVLCLAAVAYWLPHSLAQFDLSDKTMLMFCVGLWAATLHACYRRMVAAWRTDPSPGLPGEGVLLGAMLLACTGFGATLAPVAEKEEGPPDDGTALYRVVWRYRPPAPSWIASSPLAEGERLYVGVVHATAFRTAGAVYCVERATGRLVWSFNNKGAMKDVFSSPHLANGRLYIGEGFHQHTGCKLYCLDAQTGAKLWEKETGSHTESTPCVSNGKVYFGAGDDGLFCVDAATGEERWHYGGLHVDANPVVSGNRVYCGSGVGDVYKETALFCLDADTGKEQWRMPTDLPMWGEVAVAGDSLYAPIGNGNFTVSADQAEIPARPAGALLCLKARTGQRVWRHDTPDGVHVRVAVDAENVYFASRDQHCYCVDRKEGKLCWKRDLGSPVVASPALVEGVGGKSVYVAASAGQVYRLDASSGDIEWTFDVEKDAGMDAALFSSPAVIVTQGLLGERRRVYFGAGLNGFKVGVLYCIEDLLKRPAGETHLIAQVVAAQGLALPSGVGPGFPQAVIASRVATLDASALKRPVN
jgi:outer membrane protein assembly factor BamB